MANVRDGSFWKHAVFAGRIGGVVFTMAEILTVMLLGQSPRNATGAAAGR